jgi:hypothetical protein
MATTTTIVGGGRYTYEVHDDWAKLPDGSEALSFTSGPRD